MSALGALDLVYGLSHPPREWLSQLLINLTLPLSKRGILSYTKFVTKVYKLCQGQWLGENICYLFCYQNILNDENFLLNHVPDIMISHLNVFRSVMKHRVLSELYTTLIVTVNNCGFKL